MNIQNFYFIDRVFPNLADVECYKARQEKDGLLDNVRSVLGDLGLSLNPFDVNHRIAVTNKIISLRLIFAQLDVSQQDVEKIYWGMLSRKISKRPWDQKMKNLILKLWQKDRTIAGIAKALYDMNNGQIHTCAKRCIYTQRNEYTPLHEIQAFLESKNLESWTLEEEERLIWGALAYEGLYPSVSARKGYRTLEDFKIIAQFPALQGVSKTPEQMWAQWNQRSSLWIIGQEMHKRDEELLKQLFASGLTEEQLAENFAATKGGMYYPDKVIENFWQRQMLELLISSE